MNGLVDIVIGIAALLGFVGGWIVGYATGWWYRRQEVVIMDFSKLLPIILSLVTGSGQYANIIKKVLELIELIIGPAADAAPVMDVKWAQAALKQLGFDPGPIDGIMGPRTKTAIEAYQKARGLTVDGWLGVETQTKLAQEVPPT